MSDHRARTRARTAEEIVASAERLVLEADPATVTVADIARGLGMTAGALYRYFPSREAILALVEARALARLADVLDEVPVADDPLEGLVALVEALVAWTRAEPGRYRLIARLLATPEPVLDGPEVAPLLTAALRLLARLSAALGAARRSGALGAGDDGARAWVLWTGLHGALQGDKLARFSPAWAGPTVARQLTAALLVGWGAAPGRVELLDRSEAP